MTVGKGATAREIDVTDLAALQSTHDDFPDDVEPGYVPPQPKEAAPLAANGAKPAADERSALLSRSLWCARATFCQEGEVTIGG